MSNGQPVPPMQPATQPAPAQTQPVPAVGAAATQPAPAPIGGVPGGGVPQQVNEWPEGDLPEQTGQGGRSALVPGIFTFRLPATLSQLWSQGTYKDFRKVLANGQPNPNLGQDTMFWLLKFSKDSPLVVEGGESHGEPMLATFNTIRLPRGSWRARDEPHTKWIHDLAFILDTCLADKSRPPTYDGLIAAINRHAGGLIRLTIGRKGECREENVRYVPMARVDPATGAAVPMDQGFDTVADPSGQKGCGKKYWTKDFKSAGAGYEASIQCNPAAGGCGAMIRGFEDVKGFLAPLA